MLVVLTRDEAERANAQGEAIQRRKAEAGIRSGVIHRDVVVVQQEALRAEVAFAKAFPGGEPTAPPRMANGKRNPKAGDGGYDFKFRNGLTVDVKSTIKPVPSHLLVMAQHWPPKADIYVLARIDGDLDVHLVGWASAETMEAHARRAEMLAGPAYLLDARRLRPMSTLVRELR